MYWNSSGLSKIFSQVLSRWPKIESCQKEMIPIVINDFSESVRMGLEGMVNRRLLSSNQKKTRSLSHGAAVLRDA